MFLVDSHCHLDLLSGGPLQDSLASVIKRAQAQGVQHIVNVCINLQGFPAVLKTAEAFPFVTASVGVHPNEPGTEIDVNALAELGRHHKVVAIGETGLDYFRMEGDLEWQRQRFRAHIEVAKKVQKPLIVHTRAAKEDTIAILREERADTVGGVMHCFTEDIAMADQALALGFYVSFAGIVTFKNAASLQAVAKYVPLERMLIETDAPYLAPTPHRGKPNEPAYLYHTAQYIAHLRGDNLEDFAQQTTHNFFTLFKQAERPHV